MRHLHAAALAAFALVLVTSAARADIINLTNGQSYRGRIASQAGGQTTIVLKNGGRVILPTDQIESVEPEEETPPPAPPPPPPEPPAEPAKAGKPEKPAEPGTGQAPAEPGAETKPAEPAAAPAKEPDEAEIRRQAAELAPEIKAHLEKLGTEGAPNAAVRASARAGLVKIGEPAVEELVGALGDPSPLRQEQAAGVLGEIGSKRAVKPLLVELEANTPKSAKPSAGTAAVLDAMAAALNKITGQNFPYQAADPELSGLVIIRMQVWWKENAEKFPPQIGEPPREPKAPESAPPAAPAEPAAPGAPTEPIAPAAPAAPAGGAAAGEAPKGTVPETAPKPD